MRARGPKIAQLLVRQEIKNFWLGARFTFSTVAQTLPGTPIWAPNAYFRVWEPYPDWLYEKHGELLSHHGGTACPREGGGRTRRKPSTLEPQISPIGADFLRGNRELLFNRG